MIHRRSRRIVALLASLAGAGAAGRRARRAPLGAQATGAANEFNDSHFHLTNYIQEGIDVRDVPADHGHARRPRRRCSAFRCSSSGRTRNSGDFAPTYYLQTDAPLYYYSFTDAYIAMAYRSLTPAEQARFDPMITGFNPADMYAADHIRRVLHDVPRRVLRHRRVHASTRSSCRRRSPARPPA